MATKAATTKASIPAIYATYTGSGEFVQGVSTLGLTREEWDALSEEQRQAALPLYTLAAETPQE